MAALVTGGAGYIGSHTVVRLIEAMRDAGAHTIVFSSATITMTSTDLCSINTGLDRHSSRGPASACRR